MRKHTAFFVALVENEVGRLRLTKVFCRTIILVFLGQTQNDGNERFVIKLQRQVFYSPCFRLHNAQNQSSEFDGVMKPIEIGTLEHFCEVKY